MRPLPPPVRRPLRRAAIVLAAVPFAAACTGTSLVELQQRVDQRYFGEPVSRAVADLGPPASERAFSDLRWYTWDTGVQGKLGGHCTLRLVADRQGTVVDYWFDGSPGGCRRLVGGI